MIPFSIKMKLLLAVAALLTIITLLNALQTAYVINQHGEAEAYGQLSRQLTLFKKELAEQRETLVEVVLKAARDEKILSDLAVLYAQALKYRRQPGDALARTLGLNRASSLNRLRLILDAARLSSAAVYLEGELSHYVTQNRMGLLSRQDDGTALVGTPRRGVQNTPLANWRTWPEASLPVMVAPRARSVDQVTTRFEFPAETLMVLHVMVPVWGVLRDVFLESVVEQVAVPETGAPALPGGEGQPPQMIGIFVFSQAFDMDFLGDIAHRTGMAPAIFSPDGGAGIQLGATGGSPPTLDAAKAIGDQGEIQIRTITHEGLSYYQALTVLQIDGEPTLILAGALSREDTLATIRQTITRITLTGVLIFLIVASLGYLLLTRMVAPINRLTRAASRMGLSRGPGRQTEGGKPVLGMPLAHYLQRPIQARSNDEIGALTHAFNTLATQLHDLIEDLETQVQRRTAQLEAARKQAHQYLEIAGVILVAIDTDFRVTLINQKGCQMLATAAADIVGREWFETFVPARRRREVRRRFESLMAGGGEREKHGEYPIQSVDGRQRLFAWHHALLKDGHGHVTGVLSSGEDITDRRRAEEMVLGLNHDLQERAVALTAANKELEAFAYSVSHDLRAPLRHISGFLELLEKHLGGRLDEQGHHYMETISNAAHKMEQLIDDLLSFSRMARREMTLKPVALDVLVKAVIEELAPDAAGREIDWHLGELPPVRGDGALLQQVLLNLIANALKFTRPRETPRIEIGSQAGQGAETVIYVRDNGVGFDMQYVDKLFGVFQRLHRAKDFEGTGIGLATVRRIIARHGGRTWAEGVLDQGATFYIALPQGRQEGRVALDSIDGIGLHPGGKR